MPQFNGDVIFLDASGQVRATNGSLTLRGDDTGSKSIIVGSGESLRPDRDNHIGLGRADLRWKSLYAASGIFNTIASPTSGTVVEVATSLRPNRNAIYALGTPDSAWATMHATSGHVDELTIVSTLMFENAVTVDQNDDIDWSMGGNTLSIHTGTFSVESMLADSVVITGILSTRNVVPDADILYAIGNSTLRYGRMHSASGVFNMLAPSSSGTFIAVDDADIIPLGNARRAIGSLTQRLQRVHVASGIFGTIGAATSGTFVEAAASFVPNRTNIYSLGTSTQRWANLFATSGSITTLSASTVDASAITASSADLTSVTINDLIVNRTITLDDGDGLTIVDAGPITWDLGGNTLDFQNGTPTFDSIVVTNNATIGDLTVGSIVSTGNTVTARNIIPGSDRLYAIGTSALRWSRMHAASGLFNTLGPQSSGTFVNVIGSLVPEKDAFYSLGTSALKWGNLFATSGTVTTLSSTTINATDITGSNSVTSLNSLTALGLALLNGGTFFGNAAAPSTDATTPFGLQGFRWSQLYAVSGMMESIVPLPSCGYMMMHGHFLPGLDRAFNLGSSTNRWAELQAASGTFLTRATIKNAPIVTNQDARTTVHAIVSAQSGAIINSNRETDIYNYTIPANTLSPSGKLTLELIGSVTNMTAGTVNFTPRMYLNGTVIWGDLFAVPAGPRPRDYAMYVDICSLGSMTGQRVRGTVELGLSVAGSITGNGDFGSTFSAGANWSSVATSGTVDFSTPVNLQVSMTMGSTTTLASYSGFHCILTHQPFPTLL